MKRVFLLLLLALSLSSCQIFVDATLASLGWDSQDSDDGYRERERRKARNEASRERARNAQIRSESYEEKD